MSHTPGPWTYQEPGWDGLPYLTSANGEVVATFFSEPENSSDIQLLAAAPELYEALKNIMDFLVYGDKNCRIALKAQAALAKARGEEGEENA